jgi:hypothetical protein
MDVIDEKQKTFLLEELKRKKKELKSLEKLLNNEKDSLDDQIKKVDEEWEKVVAIHKKPLRLVILAEAPTSPDNYFYIKQSTFLNGLRKQFKLNKNVDLPAKMLERGILLLDIYKLPIPSEFYRVDTNNVLFDPKYFKNKLEHLHRNKLIGDETKFVFRYKVLFNKKKLHLNNEFIEAMNLYCGKLILDIKNPISLFDKLGNVNKAVVKYL